MPLNPFTGEIEGYDSPSTTAGVGMAAMSMTGTEMPLAFRMLEQSPGFMAAAGFSAFRGSNTLIRGGSKPDLFSLDRQSSDFFGSGKKSRFGPGNSPLGRRAARLADESTKTPFLRPALRNNLPRPRNFSQFTDLSIFADSKYNRYTPFGASGLADRMVGKRLASKAGIDLATGETAIGSGLFSFVSAGRKIDKMEEKALKRASRGKDTVKIMSRLNKVDDNIRVLGEANNVGGMFGMIDRPVDGGKVSLRRSSRIFSVGSSGPASTVGAGVIPNQTVGAANRVFAVGASGASSTQTVGLKSTSLYDESYSKRVRSAFHGPTGTYRPYGQVGVRGNLMASSMAGGVTRYAAGYFRGAQGFGRVDGLADNALKGARAARFDMFSAVQRSGIDTARFGTGRKAGLAMADEALEKGVFKTLGKEGVFKAMTTKAGAKVLGARAAAMAVPGLNVVATAMFAYDLAQMGGEIIKSGINLAKDAHKSLQGTIAKPTFGMGYKDTEAAATSRSRGVMAIQNSRLNMRSLLGNEAAMMASYYG